MQLNDIVFCTIDCSECLIRDGEIIRRRDGITNDKNIYNGSGKSPRRLCGCVGVY